MARTNVDNQFLAFVYEDYSAFIDNVSDEELGQFIRAQIDLSKGRTVSELSGITKALFDTHNALIDKNRHKCTRLDRNVHKPTRVDKKDQKPTRVDTNVQG